MLDTVQGCGAAGMVVEVHCAGAIVAVVALDDGGRAELLADIAPGGYELHFMASAYFGTAAEHFYDVIPVRFNVTDGAQKYHIPLILSAFGYSTYRGG